MTDQNKIEHAFSTAFQCLCETKSGRYLIASLLQEQLSSRKQRLVVGDADRPLTLHSRNQLSTFPESSFVSEAMARRHQQVTGRRCLEADDSSDLIDFPKSPFLDNLRIADHPPRDFDWLQRIP